MKMCPYALTPPNQLGKRGAHFNEFKAPPATAGKLHTAISEYFEILIVRVMK